LKTFDSAGGPRVRKVTIMNGTRTLLVAAALLGLSTLPTLAAGPAATGTSTPVVVELFTSQGCSSCPPADAYLGELAKQPGIVALAFHVDYWDYIGWKDPYAFSGSTERQRGYTAALGGRYLYTPEMIVGGQHDATGSDRTSVDELIRANRAAKDKIALAVTEPTEDHYKIEIPASGFKGTATVWMAVFDKEHATTVARGENEGHTLRDYNVVRELRRLGRYDGKAAEIDVPMALTQANGCAILVQADHESGDGLGPILGAAVITENKAG
jgi:hypothetical protein